MDLLDIDHYNILGLPSGEEGAKLSAEEISYAYRSKFLELNPQNAPYDPNAHKKLQSLKTSYVILKDEKARKLFDQLLRLRLEKLQRQSQHDSKHPRMIANLDERAQTSFPPDPNSQGKDDEEIISTKLKEEITRIWAMHGNAAASSIGVKKLAEVGGQGSRDGNQSGQITSSQRLSEFFGENFKVEPNQTSSYMKKRNPRFYKSDIVQRNRDLMHGRVSKVAGDIASVSDSSESEIYIEDSDVDDEEECNVKDEDCSALKERSRSYIPDDELEVIWWDGSCSTIGTDEVTLVDRYFSPGDIVAKASDPTCQLGVVVDIHRTVQLSDSHRGGIIGNVLSSHLKRVWEIEKDDYVIHGYWIGKVDDVSSEVGSASVTWFHNNYPGISTTPAKEQNTKNIKVLPHFQHAQWVVD